RYTLSRAATLLFAKYPDILESFNGKPWLLLRVMNWFRYFLRKSWEAKDDRHRDWYLFEMRKQFRDALIEASDRSQVTPEFEEWLTHPADGPPPVPYGGLAPLPGHDPRSVEPPEVMPLEAAILHFQKRIGDRAKYCGNENCHRPYFIAR